MAADHVIRNIPGRIRANNLIPTGIENWIRTGDYHSFGHVRAKNVSKLKNEVSKLMNLII